MLGRGVGSGFSGCVPRLVVALLACVPGVADLFSKCRECMWSKGVRVLCCGIDGTLGGILLDLVHGVLYTLRFGALLMLQRGAVVM